MTMQLSLWTRLKLQHLEGVLQELKQNKTTLILGQLGSEQKGPINNMFTQTTKTNSVDLCSSYSLSLL